MAVSWPGGRRRAEALPGDCRRGAGGGGQRERRVALRLSAKGIPVYEMVQEIPAGERLDEMRMWRRLTQSLARDWELPREGAERLLNSDFYF